MANRSEIFPNMASGSSFFILYGETYNLSGAGACAGVDTVTAGSSVSGHTTRQILCRGLDAFDVKKPVFASSSTPSASICFPAPCVGAAPSPLGRQPTDRPLAPISCISDIPSTLPPDSIWREELDGVQSTTDPPRQPYGSHHRQTMGTNEKTLLPVSAAMPTDTAPDTVPSEKIQIGTQLMQAANLKYDAETTHIGLAKKEARTPALGKAKSTHLRMPGMQTQEEKGGEWREAHNKKNRGSKEGNTTATASMNMGMPQSTPTISMPYKMHEPRAKALCYTDRFKNGQHAHTNSKGKQPTAPKDNATLLPAGDVTSPQQMPTLQLVVETPENMWKRRLAAKTSPNQGEEKADNEGNNISGVNNFIDTAPPINILGENLISPEPKILDAMEEAQKAKEEKRQAKKQRRAIEKATSNQGLDVGSVQVRAEVLSKQRTLSQALALPAAGLGRPGLRFEPVSYRIQCLGQLMHRVAHPFRAPRGLVSSFLPGDSWRALIQEIRTWLNLPTLKARQIILICRQQGKRISQDLHCRRASVYSLEDTWRGLDMKLDLLVIIPGHPEERKYRNVISMIQPAEWCHPLYRHYRLYFLDFSTVPKLASLWQRLPPIEDNQWQTFLLQLRGPRGACSGTGLGR